MTGRLYVLGSGREGGWRRLQGGGGLREGRSQRGGQGMAAEGHLRGQFARADYRGMMLEVEFISHNNACRAAIHLIADYAAEGISITELSFTETKDEQS